MGIFYVNNINRKKMIFLPILRRAFQSAGDAPCLHSVSSRWEQPIKSQFVTCNVKNSWSFLFLFLPFCCLFSCCDFCFGSACRGRGGGEDPSGGAGGPRPHSVLLWLVVLWWTVRCAFECSEPPVCLWHSCVSAVAVNRPGATHVLFQGVWHWVLGSPHVRIAVSQNLRFPWILLS